MRVLCSYSIIWKNVEIEIKKYQTLKNRDKNKKGLQEWHNKLPYYKSLEVSD